MSEAPAPTVVSAGEDLWLAYRTRRDPDHCAVVRFRQTTESSWGDPLESSSAALPVMPRSGFYEIRPSAPAGGGRRWVVTFPDAVLQVRAMAAEVALRATAAASPAHALAALLA